MPGADESVGGHAVGNRRTPPGVPPRRKQVPPEHARREDPTMTTRIRTITVDCRDWRPLVAFWSALTDYVEDPENPNEDADDEGLLVPADGAGPALLFLPVPEGKTVKNRVHLDLEPLDRTRDETLEEVLRLGGSVVEDHRRPDGSGWVTVADPEGNEALHRAQRGRARRAHRAVRPLTRPPRSECEVEPFPAW
ncbi:hypothetical protein GCM10025868_01560 [Angustibacter aerolatus]|uniref:Glyoxalase-like domain-containing protein n=1 Tax=Angustibacter aerolatus TaxID=1162965 RepID=A0ABQ6JDP7_9ACTN|nr:hypothetical protein GCM10025868_01560 [Angustibacter aerolatus]